MPAVVLRGGRVVDGRGGEPTRADVLVVGNRIAGVGTGLAGIADADVVDCADRYVLPGLVDVHSHADATVFESEVQRALLRQGVTSVVAGQDGVSYAPGDGSYATTYFGALLGPHPAYGCGGVASLLAAYDGAVPVNVAYLVPHGTVRHEVLGDDDRAPTDDELVAMEALVRRGLAEGAVGLSTGLDYVPGLFADAAEIARLCVPVAEASGTYVTHMRGGYEHAAAGGVTEVVEICRASGVRGHLSHYHGPGDTLVALLDEAAVDGVALTYDAYPYRAGCTLLSMPVLPPDLLREPVNVAVARLRDPAYRAWLLREWMPSVASVPATGPGWEGRLRLAFVAAERHAWAAGLTPVDAAARVDADVHTFLLDLLADSDLAVTAVMPVPDPRPVDDLAVLVRDSRHMGGSDGIYLGTHPHPRGWGSFARLLGRHTRERADLTWGEAAAHLSAHPVSRLGLGTRGRVEPGAVADLIVVDPSTVTDQATYADPRHPAVGIDDVLVAGVPVLHDGALTGATPGTGIRRSP
ncbi:MAG: amidohydrolase family protein [Streptosporangiales bacterium]|nr:amidohydrolase family protein [Streptosporangiales bacterium]